MWSPVGPHVQWNMSNEVTRGTCLMWSPVGPHVQWDLSNVVTYWNSFLSAGSDRTALLLRLKCMWVGENTADVYFWT